MSKLVIADQYAPLLRPLGIGSLPVATPLDLAQLPIVRPTHQLSDELRDPDGNLPREAWETRTWQIDPSGVRREVTIRGSPKEGLPYGRDWDVILGLALLIVENGYYDGVIQDASLNRIAGAIGKELTGPEASRILGALSRFAGTQIETSVPLIEPEEADRILRGESRPHPPPRSASRKVRRAKISLLSLVWDTETLSTADGRTLERARIQHLALDPLLVHYAIAGGVAWIDAATFMAIGDTPIARALYLFAASEVARGRIGPWHYELDELRDMLGMRSDQRPARTRDFLDHAANLLQEHRVLSAFSVAKAKGRGRYTVVLEPGPLLGVARLLRGAGLHELLEVQLQMVLLGSIGINSARARDLIRQSPHDVYLHLAYLKYMEETQPDAITSPAGWFWDSFRKGVPLDTDQVFMQWLESRGAPGPSVAAAVVVAPAPRTLPPPPPPAAELLPPRDAEAVRLWGEVKPHLLERFPGPFSRLALEAMAPYAVEGGVLVLRTANSFHRDWISGNAWDAILDLLAEHAGAAAASLKIELAEPHGDTLQDAQENASS